MQGWVGVACVRTGDVVDMAGSSAEQEQHNDERCLRIMGKGGVAGDGGTSGVAVTWTTPRRAPGLPLIACGFGAFALEEE